MHLALEIPTPMLVLAETVDLADVLLEGDIVAEPLALRGVAGLAAAGRVLGAAAVGELRGPGLKGGHLHSKREGRGLLLVRRVLLLLLLLELEGLHDCGREPRRRRGGTSGRERRDRSSKRHGRRLQR
ncbi:hypothetical protein KEM55_008147 [Ascosphaera atra]|nr:hypothetical protein KEM55_008147 [Ascosphaera atra]